MVDADQAAKLETKDIELAACVARREVKGERRPRALMVHGKPAKFIAAAFDEADDPPDRAFAGLELYGHPLRVLKFAHQRDSIISTFDLLGGTSGQTLARGSIRA